MSASTTTSAASILTPSSRSGTPAATVAGASGALFREIHKNTWLKRLTAEGKKITVGPKKSERSWVVFCVHDDTEGLLEGYAEPRQAASHLPEWIVSLQKVQHISHALIPNSHEFEFVVTLSDEVVRFHAMSWEIMQEWVETLRAKLREMKILSPRENLYTKLPEVRPPLLPTRDPTSPLPATPPVPAALVPGIERVVAQPQATNAVERATNEIRSLSFNNVSPSISLTATQPPPIINSSTPSMSNTSTQNLLNMLSDPMSNYSEQISEVENHGNDNAEDEYFSNATEEYLLAPLLKTDIKSLKGETNTSSKKAPLARTFGQNFLSELRPAQAQSLHSSSGGLSDNSVRVDIALEENRKGSMSTAGIMQSYEKLNPRVQGIRSSLVGEQSLINSSEHNISSASTSNNNVIELEIDNNQKELHNFEKNKKLSTSSPMESESTTNITIIQVSNMSIANFSNTTTIDTITPKSTNFKEPDIFKFPDLEEHKSNVQIIPSNSSTIPVGGLVSIHTITGSAIANQYSSPKKNISPTSFIEETKLSDNNKITMVQVGSDCITESGTMPNSCSTTENDNGNENASSSEVVIKTPVLPKKIILSTNTSGVTNIAVNNDREGTINSHNKSFGDSVTNKGTVHYEKVFLTSSIPIISGSGSFSLSSTSSSSVPSHARSAVKTPISRLQSTCQSSPTFTPLLNKGHIHDETNDSQKPSTSASCQSTTHIDRCQNRKPSPAVSRKQKLNRGNNPPNLPVRPPFLTRGLTEAVISGRPSRKDQMRTTLSEAATKLKKPIASNTTSTNNNGELPSISDEIAGDRARSESLDQRRRSSSTSDAQRPRVGNNNELLTSPKTQMQQPPQPFKKGIDSSSQSSSASKRLTLREQQVLQLRREIMHPGGVRLQLRRKDCIGSIAWVDAFGAVWIAGWKQKEHPVLYNALHIGDQLISIAGVTISTAGEANKIIRNANTLFVEVLVRRIPFGRGYAIRREREGQCLGLIRDGNTSTIVDVVPNSLAARHGLPPKAHSCDGTTLTFWVLTEINGRPLNLFFKDNEIRDRLNSVGRDISILVQPSDLITKLKKQLKSLRGHKDYLVQ